METRHIGAADPGRTASRIIETRGRQYHREYHESTDSAAARVQASAPFESVTMLAILRLLFAVQRAP
jgi:hypothetical protein